MRFVPKLVQVNAAMASIGSLVEVKGSGLRYTLRGWSSDGKTLFIEDDRGNVDLCYHGAVMHAETAILESLPPFAFFRSHPDSNCVYIRGSHLLGCIFECAQIALVDGKYEWGDGSFKFLGSSRVWPVEIKEES